MIWVLIYVLICAIVLGILLYRSWRREKSWTELAAILTKKVLEVTPTNKPSTPTLDALELSPNISYYVKLGEPKDGHDDIYTAGKAGMTYEQCLQYGYVVTIPSDLNDKALQAERLFAEMFMEDAMRFQGLVQKKYITDKAASDQVSDWEIDSKPIEG